MIASLIILILIFAFADRFAGGGLGWPKLSLRGRPLWYAGPLAGALVWMTAGPLVAAVAFGAFMIWRGPGWKVFGRGGIAPQSWPDIAALALRHSLASVALPLAAWVGLDPYKAVSGLVCFILGATLIGIIYSASVEKGRDIGAWSEIARGALFGAFVWSLIA